MRPNVALVRRAYEAFARRDMPTVLEIFAPDVELTQSDEIPWGGTHHGLDGVATFFGKLTGAVASVVTIERLIDAGDTVVAIGRTAGTVNASGVPFDVPVAHVWTIRDGRAVRVQFDIDNPTMLAALGAA